MNKYFFLCLTNILNIKNTLHIKKKTRQINVIENIIKNKIP